MKLSAEQKLAIYRPVLARYERDGDPMAEVQRKLIAALEKEISNAP